MEYPRLLIINNYSFNDYKGGGITLKNLFQGWPKDKLAIAHWDDAAPMADVCLNYYKIGYNESQYIFPLNKISTEPRGRINGKYSIDDFQQISSGNGKTTESKALPTQSKIKGRFLNMIDTTGLREFLHPMKLSRSLKSWILEYQPEIIYCQPENISFINLVLKAQELTNAKVVVHVMDDWPYMVYKTKSMRQLLRSIVDHDFRKLLKRAGLRLGISKAMADEFESRYNLPFGYFHNPIDISKAGNIEKKTPEVRDSFQVVYSGRIGVTASHDSILEFSRCIQMLRNEGMDISFTIYTDLNNKENDFSKFDIEGTSLQPALKDHNFITKLQEADLLLYPVDFDQKSIEFIRLSFPTKLPSYLISGVPVFCYGPAEVYSLQFMMENKLGFICNDQDINILKQKLQLALTNIRQRDQYAKDAFAFAESSFEKNKVRTAFHQAITNTLNS